MKMKAASVIVDVEAMQFAAAIEALNEALRFVGLFRYADHVTVVVPRDAKSFAHFVQWAETLSGQLATWSLSERPESKDYESLNLARRRAFDVANHSRVLLSRLEAFA